MNMKEHILTALAEEFNRWEELLASMNEEQITAPRLPNHRSIKDVVAHMWAWQQRSIARLNAAVSGREPEFAKWLADVNPDSEDSPNRTNEWIYQTYRELPWSTVHENWRKGFLRFLELGKAISEEDLIEKEYPWLKGYWLYMILVSSYAHLHIEHYGPLLAWLKEHGEKEQA
ncbi:MAG: ClbS/DfsB family four-helix bundle protein [Chloroflexi bacterium]|nr:ClbS/DfsB family four-helix bundle protein [Chloroflexota bacterium]